MPEHIKPQPIPQAYCDLFERKTFAQLATVMPDGTPQVTPVWIDYDGQYILVNSAKGRVKDRNMRARPQVGLSILDPDDTHRYISVQGRVVEVSEDGARAHADALSKRYTGRDKFGGSPDETRVVYKIAPTRVYASG